MANAKLVNFVYSRFSKKPMVLHRKRTFTDLQLGWLSDVRAIPLQKRSLPVTCEGLFICWCQTHLRDTMTRRRRILLESSPIPAARTCSLILLGLAHAD